MHAVCLPYAPPSHHLRRAMRAVGLFIVVVRFLYAWYVVLCFAVWFDGPFSLSLSSCYDDIGICETVDGSSFCVLCVHLWRSCGSYTHAHV